MKRGKTWPIQGKNPVGQTQTFFHWPQAFIICHRKVQYQVKYNQPYKDRQADKKKHNSQHNMNKGQEKKSN